MSEEQSRAVAHLACAGIDVSQLDHRTHGCKWFRCLEFKTVYCILYPSMNFCSNIFHVVIVLRKSQQAAWLQIDLICSQPGTWSNFVHVWNRMRQPRLCIFCILSTRRQHRTLCGVASIDPVSVRVNCLPSKNLSCCFWGALVFTFLPHWGTNTIQWTPTKTLAVTSWKVWRMASKRSLAFKFEMRQCVFIALVKMSMWCQGQVKPADSQRDGEGSEASWMANASSSASDAKVIAPLSSSPSSTTACILVSNGCLSLQSLDHPGGSPDTSWQGVHVAEWPDLDFGIWQGTECCKAWWGGDFRWFQI